MSGWRSGILAVAVVMALSCTGCVRTGEDAARHQARQLALEDAEKVAGKVERIASAYRDPAAGPSDRVLRRELAPGQPWTGFLGAVEVSITREAETGGGLSYATGEAIVCVRFELHGDNGPRRVTTREIDCPPSR